jgi:hypothetical protein
MKKPALIFCILMIALNNLAAFGQIKIPKIFKPTDKPTVEAPTGQTSNPQNPNSPPNNRQTSGDQIWTPFGEYIDDGFSWFQSLETNDLDAKQLRVPTGWTLKSSMRLMGVYPKRSAVKFVVSQGGKMIGTTRCEASAYNMPPNQNVIDVSYIAVDGCHNKAEMTTKETGKFDVEVFLIDGATNAERSVRKYKIEVIQINRVNSQIGKLSKPDAPRYVVLRHAETPASVLFLRPAGTYDYFNQQDGRSQGNRVEIYYSISPTKEGWGGLPLSALRCSVNGTRIKLREAGSQTDIVSSLDYSSRRSYEIYTDRLVAPYSTGGPAYEDDFGFRVYRATLPLTYGSGRADPSRLNMKEHPGNWECNISQNGDVLRTWRWTIGSDGMPVKHAEQNGNVNLFSNAYLVHTEIQAGGTNYDKRLAPTSANEGFFYGQKWTSMEGKAMAGKVPVKGSLLPVPSNKIQK